MAEPSKAGFRRKIEARVRQAQDQLDWFRDQTEVSIIRQMWRDITRKFGITRTGQLALIAAVVLWIVGRIVAGTTLYVIAYGIATMVIMSYFLAPRKLRLVAQREGLFPRAQEGDHLEVYVKASAERSISAFQLEERVPERLGQPLRVPISRVKAGEDVVHSYALSCSRRGVYIVGPLVAITSDPVGVVQRETLLMEPFELLVHPRVTRVSDRPLTRLFEDPPIRPPVSKPWPSGMEFYGMREYRRGDDLRRIVWRATARTGKLMVREAEQGITDHITMILDTDRGSHSREGDYSESFEMGVRACASLGVRHLTDGYEIKVESNAGPLTLPIRGRNKTLGFLDVMSRAGMSRQPLTNVLGRLIADPRRDAHTILITPRISSTEAAQLKLLIDKGVSITVVALVWDESDTQTMGVAAALGCQVAAVAMGQDLAEALHHDIGAGNRI